MNKVILIISVFILFSCNKATDKQGGPVNPVNSTGPKIEKAYISFRIGVPHWTSKERSNEILGLFDKYKGVTDEVTFFTSETHAPFPPEVIRQRTILLKELMAQIRKKGYKTGINILTSIGHHEENLENSLKGDYTPMANIDGKICRGSFCPNDENLRKYIQNIYQYSTKANPDYIWIDDDVRFGHMPIGYGCFCDHCLEIFEKETGTKYTRESLKKALNEGPIEEKLKVRKEWLQHNRNTISRLFELIEKTVHEINPKLPLGFMTGDRFF